jgi:hypothetical protein
MQNKDISLSHMSFGFSTTLFRCVSAPLDIKKKANPDKVDWFFFRTVCLFFLRRRIVDVNKKLWAKNLHHFFKNVVAIFDTN